MKYKSWILEEKLLVLTTSEEIGVKTVAKPM